MESTRPHAGRGGDTNVDATSPKLHRPLAAKRRQAANNPAHAKTPLNDPEAVASAIGLAAPFSAWPRDALIRLAGASRVTSHRSGTTLIVAGQPCDQITVIADGTVLSSVSTPGGRRLTFKIDDAAFAYGLASLSDGLPQRIDLVADQHVSVIRAPLAAVRAELTRMPSLWEPIAVETIRRSRCYAMQLNQFVFDTPLVRAATLLLGLLARSGKEGHDDPVDIDYRLSQERLADTLGVSRQWATALVRELS